MVVPKFVRVLNKGLIAGAVVGALGFFIKSIPCKITTADSVSLGICTLPPLFENISDNPPNIYYGISNNPATGLVFQILVATIIITIALILFRRKAAKVLDLTNKH